MLYNDKADRKRPENKALELTLAMHFTNLSSNKVEVECAMLRNMAVDTQLIEATAKIVKRIEQEKVTQYVR